MTPGATSPPSGSSRRCSATSRSIARRTREWPALTLGASPRAAINLMQVAKALAAMDGRDYLLPDDVKSAAPPVLRHRLVLKPEADLEGLTPTRCSPDVLRRRRGPEVIVASARAGARNWRRRSRRAGWPWPSATASSCCSELGVLLVVPAWIDRTGHLAARRRGTPSSLGLWVLDLRRIPSGGDHRGHAPLDGTARARRPERRVARPSQSRPAFALTRRRSSTMCRHRCAGICPRCAWRWTRPGRARAQLRSRCRRQRGDADARRVVAARAQPLGDRRALAVGADAAQTVRVYPDLAEARRQSLFLLRSRQVAHREAAGAGHAASAATSRACATTSRATSRATSAGR